MVSTAVKVIVRSVSGILGVKPIGIDLPLLNDIDINEVDLEIREILEGAGDSYDASGISKEQMRDMIMSGLREENGLHIIEVCMPNCPAD